MILGGAVVLAIVIVAIRLLLGNDSGPLPAPVPPTVAAPTTQPPPPPPAATATIATSPAAAVAQDGAPAPDGRNVVCLDPGHGGSDLGNVRREQRGDTLVDVLYEKNFTLPNALDLAERLRTRGIEVDLTRDSDTVANAQNRDVNNDGTVAAAGGEADSDESDDLQERVLTCNAAGADLLVSIHYNGAENTNLQGYEVWYNGDRPFSDRSARFAALMHEELKNAYQAASYDANDRGVGLEDHAVTGPTKERRPTASAMPGAVVEALFLSNDEDAAFVMSGAAEDAIVGAYERAIVRYFEEFPG